MAGAEKSLLLLASCLCDDFAFSTACPKKSTLAHKMEELGIECFSLPIPVNKRFFHPRRLLQWIMTGCHLLKIILTSKYAIIHANNIYAVTVSALPALVTGKKLIWHARDLNRYGWIARSCSWFCDRIIAISYTVRRNLVEQGINPEKITVVYNGTAIPSVEESNDRSHYDTFVFANIGQFIPWKKQEVFLQAASRVRKTLPHAKFYLVGDDLFGRDSQYKSMLLQKIQELNLEESVRVLGWQEDMTAVWSQIDCLVHTADREPFGRVVIEAMAAHVPVIATNGAGPGEIISHDATGILVQPDNIEELCNAMVRLGRDCQLRMQLVSSAYQHAQAHFSASQMAEATRQVYEKVLSA